MSTSAGSVLPGLFRDRRVNAGLAWVGVALIWVVVVAEALLGDFVSAIFGLGVVVVVLVVPAIDRSVRTMLPWEVVALASLPTVGRAVFPETFAGSVATYLAVAAVALMIAVELNAFTTVSMNYEFALLFVVVTTLAAAGVWAVVRWLIDLQFGTGFIPDNRALMVEFVQATVAGVGAGILFRVYFRPRVLAGRIPEEALAVDANSTDEPPDGSDPEGGDEAGDRPEARSGGVEGDRTGGSG